MACAGMLPIRFACGTWPSALQPSDPKSPTAYSPSEVDRILGNIRVKLGLYGNNGKEHGSHYNGLYRI